jgi:diacylglycerol kinase family enzyme
VARADSEIARHDLHAVEREERVPCAAEVDDRIVDDLREDEVELRRETRGRGPHVGTRERLDGGHLSIYTTQRCSPGGLISLAFRGLIGRLHQADDFAVAEARRLRVETRHKRLLVATDGEINVMETPLDFRIVSGALDVLVPVKKE